MIRPHAIARAIALLAAVPSSQVALANHAATSDSGPQTLIIQGRYDNAVGTSDAASAGSVGHNAVQGRGAQRPGDVLEFVPGVVVTQHSGDGKANQYFLRGFNLDHGTDFATRLGGMPLNMPSHGHGQGYTDMNFLIPELVDRITYRKGPYAAAVGNFAAAGSTDITYLSKLRAPFAQVTLGSGDHRRGVTGMSTEVSPGVTALGAVEALNANGPWEVPQGLQKRNGILQLTGGTADDGWHVAAMAYHARWTATDQVPQRLLDAGALNGQPFGRFASLDRTTGGDSSRTSLSGDWHRQHAAGRTTLAAYTVHSDLDLYSNFTYGLERPAQGDQFKQTDRRTIHGINADHRFEHDLGKLPLSTTVGLQWRHDQIRNGLFDSVARNVTATVREDAVQESMLGVWMQSGVEFTPTLRAVAGMRLDHLRVAVDARSLPANGGKASDTQVSPKLSLIWTAAPRTEWFVNVGRGLHSNDARGQVAQVDPRTGDPIDRVPGLVPLFGSELGLRTQAIPGMQWSVSAWSLRSRSELVYVGDAGNTEASLGSRRHGIELSNRWQASPWLLIDADASLNHARFTDGSRIPNSVDRVASLVGTVVGIPSLPGWSASLKLRHLGPGALTEDNSVRSIASTTVNLRVTRELGKRASLTLDVFNLGNRSTNDIQYYYESRLPGDAAGVADRHVHPAEPRTARLTLQATF